jgi:tetratricopeptide (TPR) repeat protein
VAYLGRGLARKEGRDLDGALADFNRAIELTPNDAMAYVYRGRVKAVIHNVEGAIADFNQAIEFDPKSKVALHDRGLAKRHKNDMDGAMVDFNHAIELDPKSASAYGDRGDLEMLMINLDAATADYSKAIELDPTASEAYFIRGVLRQEQGRMEEAISDFRRCIEIRPADQDYSRMHIWIVRTKKGDKDAAHAELSAYFDKRKKFEIAGRQTKIIEFLLGRITEAEFLSADDPSNADIDIGQQCEFWFYAGMKQELAGDKKAAVIFFRKCIATQKTESFYYQCAKAELKSLGE